MGGSSKPKQSDESRKAEQLSIKLMKQQLKDAKKEIPVPKAPDPVPPAPPLPQASGSDAENAAEEERRRAMRRTNTGRNTLFAGETGGYKAAELGGQKTLLG